MIFLKNYTFILAKIWWKQLHSHRSAFADAAYLKHGKLYKVQHSPVVLEVFNRHKVLGKTFCQSCS